MVSSHLFNARALLLVGVVGQLEVFGNVVVPGRLLDLDLLRELEDLLLQLGDGLLGALWVRGAILSSGERTVRPARDSERRLAQPAHLQSVNLRRGRGGTERNRKRRKAGGWGRKKWRINREGKGVNTMWIAFEILLTRFKNGCFCIFCTQLLKKRVNLSCREFTFGHFL